MNSLGPSIDLSTCVSAAIKTAAGLNFLKILIHFYYLYLIYKIYNFFISNLT